MNLPKTIKDYCRKCRKHTSHRLRQFKPSKARALAAGTRSHERKTRGYGGKAEFPAKVKKQSKKPAFVAECVQCKSRHYFVIPKRIKKIELVEKAA